MFNVWRNLAEFEFGAVQTCVNLVDLVKSFNTSTSIDYYLIAKIGFDTAENESYKVSQELDS